MKKILFCDMDGTIVDLKGLLYPPDKENVVKLHQAGHLFAFNTGRNYEEAMRCINKLGLYYDYLVLNNGAHIVDRNGHEIFKRVISKQEGIDIIEHCLKYDNMWVNFYDGKKTLGYLRGQTYVYDEMGQTMVTTEYDFIKEYPKVAEFDIIALYQENQQIDEVLKIQKYVEEHYHEHAHGTLNTHYLDITPSGCTKGTGISNLVDLLEEEVESYAIGDSYNDLSMFEHADHGYTFNRVDSKIKQHSEKQVEHLSELIEEMLK